MNDEPPSEEAPAGESTPLPGPPVNRIGEYQLGEALEADPGAEVFRAIDPLQPPGERDVAIEFFPRLKDTESRRRFDLFRAQMVMLELPGVPMALEAGVAAGRPYVIRRLIPGDTLATLRSGRGAMRPDEAVRLMLPVIDAVAFAHTRGLIHGDITAAHLRVDPGSMIFLEGFGSAALRRMTEDNASPVVAGDIAGLATVLRGLVRGVKRVNRNTGPSAQLAAVTSGKKTAGSWSDLEAILQRAGANDPEAEEGSHASVYDVGYGSVAEFAADLRAWLMDRPLMARPPSGSELLRDWAWMHPFSSLAMLCGLLILLALPVGFSWWRQKRVTGVEVQSLSLQRHELDYVGNIQRAHAALEAGAWERLDAALTNTASSQVAGPEVGLLRAWLEVRTRDLIANLGSPIQGLAMREDGSRLLAWTARGVDVMSSQPGGTKTHLRLQGTNPPLAADFVPDERVIAVGTAAGVFLQTVSGADTGALPSPVGSEPTSELKVSPDGAWIAAVPLASSRPDPGYWMLNLLPLQGRVRGIPLQLPLAPVVSWAWIEPEPGSPRLAVALRGGAAGSWDLANSNYVSVLTRAGEECTAAAWDAAGRILARLDSDGVLEVINFTTGESILRREGHAKSTPLIAVATGGSRVAATTANGDVLIYRIPDGSPQALLRRRQEEFTAMRFLRDGRLVTGARSGSIWAWEPESKDRQPGFVFTNHVPFIGSPPCFSPNAEWLVLPDEWRDDVERFVVQRTAQPGDPESIPGQPAGFLGPQTLLVWDKLTARWEAWGMAPLQKLGGGRLAENETWNWVTLSFDASRLALRGPGDRLEVFDTFSGQRVSGINERVDAAAISGDGRSLAVALADSVAVWIPGSSALRKRPGFHASSAAISSDGRWVAFGNERGHVRMWRAADTTYDEDLVVDATAVTALGFSAENQTLFVATAASLLEAWHLGVRQELFRHALPQPAAWLIVAPNDAGLLVGHPAAVEGETGASWWWPNADRRSVSVTKGPRPAGGAMLPDWFEKPPRRR